jgi:hypothetical protein
LAFIFLIFNSNESETASAFPLTYTTTRNGDVWRIVTETGESENLKLSGNPSDGSSYSAVYGFVIKS